MDLIRKFIKKLIFFRLDHFKEPKSFDFKEGDIVKFNWKSKCCIPKAVRGGETFRITGIIEHSNGSKSIDMISISNPEIKESAACYWLKKIK